MKQIVHDNGETCRSKCNHKIIQSQQWQWQSLSSAKQHLSASSSQTLASLAHHPISQAYGSEHLIWRGEDAGASSSMSTNVVRLEPQVNYSLPGGKTQVIKIVGKHQSTWPVTKLTTKDLSVSRSSHSNILNLPAKPPFATWSVPASQALQRHLWWPDHSIQSSVHEQHQNCPHVLRVSLWCLHEALKFVEWIHGRLLTTEAFIAPMEDLSNWLALEDIVPDTHGQSHIGLRELFSMCDSEVGSKFLPKGISRHRPMGLLHIHLEGAQLVEPLQLRQVKISKLYHTLPLTHILDSSARGTAWLKVSLCMST